MDTFLKHARPAIRLQLVSKLACGSSQAKLYQLPHRAEAREPGRITALRVNVVRVLTREVGQPNSREAWVLRVLGVLLRLVQAAAALVLGGF
jgi:hypothetical protein